MAGEEAAPAPVKEYYFREKSKFRKSLDAVRWVLAVTGALLIFGVGAYVMSLALRSEKLSVWVKDGVVSAVPDDSSSVKALTFNFTLQAANPSGRARMYFVNITATIQGKNSSTSPPASFVSIGLEDLALVQGTTATTIARVDIRRDSMKPSYFDMLYYNGSTISGSMMLLNGSLITGVSSIANRTLHDAIYKCTPLIVGNASLLDTGDIQCSIR